MKLDIHEFIRRFLLHILPDRFFKVRYYGIFANKNRKYNIALANQLITEDKELERQEASEDGKTVYVKQGSVWDEILLKIKNLDKPNCPKRKNGRLKYAGWAPG